VYTPLITDKKDNQQMQSKSRHIPEDDVSPHALERAQEEVGRTRKARLAWALEFAQQDVEELTPGDLLDDRINVKIFLEPRLRFDGLPLASVVAALREKFAAALRPPPPGPRRFFDIQLTYEMAFVAGRPAIHVAAMDPIGSGVLTFAELLRDHGLQMRRCADPKCKKWFVGRANKDFCTTTCLSRITTERLRKEKK
jgi:hypothetical protein